MNDETSRREFLELAARGAAGLAVVSILPACESFAVDNDGTETNFSFLTPPEDWFWFSAFGGQPRQSPVIDPEEWRLDVRSGGTNVAEVTFRKLKSLEAQGRDVSYLKTMRCVFGAYANDIPQTLTATGVFRGIPLTAVLEDTSISGETTKLRFRAADGFETSVSYDRLIDEEKLPIMLAYELNGRPITAERGGPVRVVVPEMWAFKSIKWVNELDATTDFSTFGTLETGELSGRTELDNPGEMSLMTLVQEPTALTAEVAGPDIQVRGMTLVGGSRIAAVEISLDDGEFERATIPELDTVLDGLGHDALLVRATEQFNQDWPYPNVWAPWTYDLTGVTPGPHRIKVRSVDVDGEVNPSISADPMVLAQEVIINLEVT